jgi:hypothetical protein
MSNGDERYFNFPISLLDGFMTDSKKVLDDIIDYAIYKYMKDYNCTIDKAEAFFGVQVGNKNEAIERGKFKYQYKNDNRFSGISVPLFFDYFEHNKSDFDKAVLLAFLALKSIVGNKRYYKLTKQQIWYNRMAGKKDKSKTLPKEVAKYCTRYQIGKIKVELFNSFNVSFYAYHTRGQYISLKLSVEELAQVAESHKQSTKQKRMSQATKEAYQKAKSESDTATAKELKRIQDFLSKHPELKDKII